MNKKFWIKLYMEILDDPKMGRLPDHLWRLAVELFLLAGREGQDGALPHISEMAWSLRVPEDELLKSIRALSEVEVVHEGEEGAWCVTHFQERQQCESSERVKRYRERYRSDLCNGEVAGVSSTSTSKSKSNSDSVSVSEDEVGVNVQRSPMEPGQVVAGGPPLPTSPAEAMLHPDVRVYTAVTGGRIPGLSQYRPVIETVRLLRLRQKLDDAALRTYLLPYWLAWSSRRRQDGRLYDPGNITWLTEWALNESIPPVPKASAPAQDRAEVIRQVAGRQT